jgi:hypothetical protein
MAAASGAPTPPPPALSASHLSRPLLVRRSSLLGSRFWFESTPPPGAGAALALGNAGQNVADLLHPSVSRPASSSLYSPHHAAAAPSLREAAEEAAAAAAAPVFSQRTPHALRPVEHITAAGWHGGETTGTGAGEERRARARAAAEEETGAGGGAAHAAGADAEAPAAPAGGDGDAAWSRAREEGAAYILGGVAAGEALLKAALADAFAAWAPGGGDGDGEEDPLVDAAALCALLHEAAEDAEAQAGERGGSEGRARRVYRAQGSARDLP